MNLPLAAVDQDAPPGVEAIHAAAARLRGRVHHTPLLGSASIDRDLGARVLFKCENFQRVGAFKARGATNAVFSLDEAEAKRGVATHSSGNHGAALALAAAERGIPCWVVVPGNATGVKRAAIVRYGARIVDCAPTMTAREAGLASVVAETGAAVVHPFDDYRVIAGQGTAALEMLDAEPDIDLLLCPVGGGGLISGCAIVAASHTAPVRVVGCEPAGADDARQSFLCGKRITLDTPETMADGLRASLGRRNFGIIRKLVDDIVTVEEVEIVSAMRLIWERMKILIEPSAAVPVAALIKGAVDIRGRTVGVILSGGNMDLNRLPWQSSGQ
ncbi:MAG: pyridoxal-phosphate dependent enzyme [Gammaproteobacteria bacterium]